MENLKRTPLFQAHTKLGGKLVDFAGWELPIQYEGIIQEHEAVRTAAGLFDVSHMGEVDVKGQDALNFIQHIITNDASKLEKNQALYTLMCHPNGGVVDDILVYKFNDEHFFLVINAANTDKDVKWLMDNSKNFNVTIDNISNKIGQVALQGPKAQEILAALTDTDLDSIKFFYCNRDVIIDGVKCLVSRTGYTGEDGFEIFSSAEEIEKVWNSLLSYGKDKGLQPAALGARDTLRFEANLPLYGNELSDEITPLEAGLGFFVKLDKNDFIGKDALVKQKSEGLRKKIVAFQMEKGIPRHGYEVYKDDTKIGFVTTGYSSPSLKKTIGLALIDAEYSALDSEIGIKIRKNVKPARIIKKSFYKRNYKK